MFKQAVSIKKHILFNRQFFFSTHLNRYPPKNYYFIKIPFQCIDDEGCSIF